MSKPCCLVGMSGVGKSYLARMLEAQGSIWHDCDRAIAMRLSDRVPVEPGEEPVHALGRWMGMPWTAGYAERERTYLELEEEVTASILDEALSRSGEAHAIDTTGSVIYLSEALLARLRESCRVFYVRTPASEYASMLELYLREPKPVVWSGLFEGFTASDLPARYAELLRDRDARYLALAHEWAWRGDALAVLSQPP